jgi:hypothetical protein
MCGDLSYSINLYSKFEILLYSFTSNLDLLCFLFLNWVYRKKKTLTSLHNQRPIWESLENLGFLQTPRGPRYFGTFRK